MRKTLAPGRFVVLYDGSCRFCTASAQKLLRLAKPGDLQLQNFQEPGALEPFPGITYDDCMKQMYLVAPDGRIFSGFEAAIQVLSSRPILSWFAYLYYLPGNRQLCDWAYGLIARNRYRLFGKTGAGDCESGTCSLHSVQSQQSK